MNACRYWRAYDYQDAAFDYLEQIVPARVQQNFAGFWRFDPENTAPIDLSKIPIYYDAFPHQDLALTWLEHELTPEQLQQFTDLWRKVPAEEGPRVTGPINWNDTHQPISRFFTVGEVTKGDPARIPVAGSEIERNILTLAQRLDTVREQWGPIGVTSWYRPPAVNAAVGGASRSFHLWGQAADVFPYSGDGREFERSMASNWHGGVGLAQASGKGFTHLDTGPYARFVY